ncbi:hypothetical protein C9374_005076 [Naegleria lovaniensis]|uniref:Ribosomal protein L11 n=1 Tax=Naegleria lovaniensis TaxID=51637 RepID=A0AA88GNP8_NAELO|nr:uncharacterized protein C9374_005076 [Naegleria lovaniensis]KAG2382496.1 hypothetical protein C9374_005076 [Naegleria lovaniensis]
MPKEVKQKKDNPMRKVQIQKLCLNISPGEGGDRLQKAARVLQDLTGQVPVYHKARLTIRSFGIRRNEKIAVSVTVRGEKAYELLERALRVKDFELRNKNFSDAGNFGFGIQEHIDLGLKYDPNIGIFGMDIFAVLGRPGLRVSKKKRSPGKVGVQHRLTSKDAKAWFVDNFKGTILN